MPNKYLLHVPTNQFEFVEVQVNSPEEARQQADEIKLAFQNNNNGLSEKEFDRVVEYYLCGSIQADDQDRLGDTKNYSQRDMMNIMRRALARIKSKENK